MDLFIEYLLRYDLWLGGKSWNSLYLEQLSHRRQIEKQNGCGKSKKKVTVEDLILPAIRHHCPAVYLFIIIYYLKILIQLHPFSMPIEKFINVT